MDFQAEALKNIAAAQQSGANLVYVCPTGNRNREAIEAAIRADAVWRDGYEFVTRRDGADLWLCMDDKLLIPYAETLPKPIYRPVRVDVAADGLESALPVDVGGSKVSKLVRDESGKPVLELANEGQLDAAADHLEAYDGPEFVLHPRPQEIGGVEYAPEASPEQETLPPEIDPKDIEGSVRKMAAALGWRIKE